MLNLNLEKSGMVLSSVLDGLQLALDSVGSGSICMAEAVGSQQY